MQGPISWGRGWGVGASREEARLDGRVSIAPRGPSMSLSGRMPTSALASDPTVAGESGKHAIEVAWLDLHGLS
jgi:hypothetical protein